MDISSLTSGYIARATDSAERANSKAAKAAEKTYAGSTEEELLDACKQFEAYFIEQVLKEVKKTIPEADYQDQPTSNLVEYFGDEVLQTVSERIQTENNLGLAQQMFEQMKRNYSNVIPMTPAEKEAKAVQDSIEASEAETEEAAEETIL